MRSFMPLQRQIALPPLDFLMFLSSSSWSSQRRETAETFRNGWSCFPKSLRSAVNSFSFPFFLLRDIWFSIDWNWREGARLAKNIIEKNMNCTIVSSKPTSPDSSPISTFQNNFISHIEPVIRTYLPRIQPFRGNNFGCYSVFRCFCSTRLSSSSLSSSLLSPCCSNGTHRDSSVKDALQCSGRNPLTECVIRLRLRFRIFFRALFARENIDVLKLDCTIQFNSNERCWVGTILRTELMRK